MPAIPVRTGRPRSGRPPPSIWPLPREPVRLPCKLFFHWTRAWDSSLSAKKAGILALCGKLRRQETMHAKDQSASVSRAGSSPWTPRRSNRRVRGWRPGVRPEPALELHPDPDRRHGLARPGLLRQFHLPDSQHRSSGGRGHALHRRLRLMSGLFPHSSQHPDREMPGPAASDRLDPGPKGVARLQAARP